jgi:hypothetical protein
MSSHYHEPQGGIRRHDHEIDQQAKKARDRTRMFVNRALERGHDALADGEWEALVEICDDLYDILSLRDSTLNSYDDAANAEDLPWSYHAVASWIDAHNPGIDAATIVQQASRDSQRYAKPKRLVRHLFLSLETATVVESHVTGKFEDTQPVWGFDAQLGERYLRPESSAGGDLDLRSTDSELKSILCAGGKGSGKSTAVESLALGSYAAGHKVVDLVDFFKAENVMYDIQQQDNGEGLLESRSEMGLRNGFDDTELGFCWLFDDEPSERLVKSPDLEVLVPMTPGLAETSVPTIPQVNEATVRPFTIPASDLTYRQLVMLLHHTTTARENHLRSAHQHLRDTGMDWTLADVADAVRTKTNAGDKMADQIETSLRTAQSKGFIRDSDCPYSLEWGEIMNDPDTITAFSVHTVKEQSDRLVVLSYLIDSLYEARRKLLLNDLLHEFPPLTAVMREMHEVAPRSKSEQDSESTIESYMIDTLERLFALTRHANMEVLGDTQKFHRQLSPSVSGLFDHILAFEGHVPDVKQIFRTRVDDTGPVERVAQFSEPGRCAFISEEGYKMPIQLAPPRCHHLEAKGEGRGLGFRARVPDTPERHLPAPWDCEIPERLRFEEGPKSPLEVFFEKFIRKTEDRGDHAVKEYITEAYNQWAEANDHEEVDHKRVNTRVKEYFDLSSETDAYLTVDGKRRYAHRTILLDSPRVNVQSPSGASAD